MRPGAANLHNDVSAASAAKDKARLGVCNEDFHPIGFADHEARTQLGRKQTVWIDERDFRVVAAIVHMVTLANDLA
jgi:hypothetical protein